MLAERESGYIYLYMPGVCMGIYVCRESERVAINVCQRREREG